MVYPLAFLLAAFLAWACNAIDLRAWRRSAGQHWTERARQLYPARISRGSNLWLIPINVTLVAHGLFPEGIVGLVFALAFAGAVLANYPMDRDTLYDLPFGRWAHQTTGWLLLQFSTIALYLGTAYVMPEEFDARVPVIAAVFLVLALALQFGLALRLMRLLRLSRPASPRLQRIVDETAATMGVRVKATWEIRRADANAMAFITTKELGFTDGLLVFCPDDELKSICAHELGHLSEDRTTVAGRLAGALLLYPIIFVRPILGTWDVYGVCILMLALAGLTFLRPRFAQKLETRADRIAAESTSGAEVYARALEHIYQVNCVPAVIRKGNRATHPDLYDRMVAAGVTPAYPRPAPPVSRFRMSYLIAVLTPLVALFALGLLPGWVDL